MRAQWTNYSVKERKYIVTSMYPFWSYPLSFLQQVTVKLNLDYYQFHVYIPNNILHSFTEFKLYRIHTIFFVSWNFQSFYDLSMLITIALFHLLSVFKSISLYKSTIIDYSFSCWSHMFFLLLVKQCGRQKPEMALGPSNPWCTHPG